MSVMYPQHCFFVPYIHLKLRTHFYTEVMLWRTIVYYVLSTMVIQVTVYSLDWWLTALHCKSILFSSCSACITEIDHHVTFKNVISSIYIMAMLLRVGIIALLSYFTWYFILNIHIFVKMCDLVLLVCKRMPIMICEA